MEQEYRIDLDEADVNMLYAYVRIGFFFRFIIKREIELTTNSQSK